MGSVYSLPLMPCMLLLSLALSGKAFAAPLPAALTLEKASQETNVDWKLLRAEMLQTLLHWQYGTVPPVPPVKVLEQSREELVLPDSGLQAVKISATLAFGPGETLKMQAGCWLPKMSAGPCPVVLAIEPVWWEDPFFKNGVVQRVLRRGCAFAGFDHNALASYEDPALRAAPDAYPGYDWGTVAVAAWGCSVTLNWLETLPEVRAERVAVWGHSRRGKSALLAGAMDARFAAVFPHMSGMGGSALYRVRGDGAQRLNQLLERYWLHERIFTFDGREDELPFDQHWLHALVAPRPLYIHAGLKDAWGNPDGERAAVEAALPVYKRFGCTHNLQLGLVDADHVDPNGPEGGPSWDAALDFFHSHMHGTAPVMTTTLVGVSYFAGWWEPLPNKWHDTDGKDWRPRFPGRVPLLGAYNTQETVNQEIVAAAGHGVDFFSILWYYNPPDGEREPNALFLSRGLECFMASPEAHRMKFMIEFCNHPPYEVTTDEEWEACIALWTRCMEHPSYLRVNGRPVFKVHGARYFVAQNGNDLARCRARLDALREAARKKGLGELIIGGGVGAHEAVGPDHNAAQLFDFTGTYMDVPPLEKEEKDYPYWNLADFLREGRLQHVNDAIPYMPVIGAGWAPHPWPDTRACFSLPNDREWETTLRQAAADLAVHEGLGLPGIKALTIYAWNEYGEGGFIAPTKGWGLRRLKAIRKVFGG